MYVALKDLEIRGAGNLLGGEQSGHIAGVGFDLYVRMIGEAVSELKGDGPGRSSPRSGSSCRSTRTSRTTTCPGSGCGLRPTPRIAAIDSDADAAAVRDELADRYGAPPEPVRNLLEVARLRAGPGGPGSPTSRGRAQHQVRAGRAARFAAVRVQRLYPGAVKPAVRTMLVPCRRRPGSAASRCGIELLAWCGEVVGSVLLEGAPA